MKKKLLPDDIFGPPPKKSSITKTAKGKKAKKKTSKPAPKTKKPATTKKKVKKKPKPKVTAKPRAAAKRAKKSAPAKKKAKTAAAKTRPPSKKIKKPVAAKPKAGKKAKKPVKKPAPKKTPTTAEPKTIKAPEPLQDAHVEAPPHGRAMEMVEKPEEEKVYEKCPACNEPLPENAHICPHCYVPIIKCPYCNRRAGALENPKMTTEQRFNRILKQFTLFGLVLPAMPVQSILDCSECRSRVIICESCHETLKHTAQVCPICGEKVRHTKMLINPITILEMILRRPDALRGLQRIIDVLIGSPKK